MIVDLVRVHTPDGCLLDGALQLPTPIARPTLDGVILVHGTGSNFYQSTLLETLAEMFCSRGIAALRVNTRGHDGISTLVTGKGGIRAGAAYEAVDDCRHDLAAWTAFARQRVGPRIALLGHSLGAVKCLYAAVHVDAINPSLVIAVSPPRLSYSWFCESARRDEFLATYQKAEDMVRRGDGGTLIEVAMPLPMMISAGGYVEKYGPEERINFLSLLSRLASPSLFVFGSVELESNVAFQEAPNEILTSTASARRDIGIVPGADHFYTGKRAELATMIGERLELLAR
jgi:alpha/beta superfamily hydrolase